MGMRTSTYEFWRDTIKSTTIFHEIVVSSWLGLLLHLTDWLGPNDLPSALMWLLEGLTVPCQLIARDFSPAMWASPKASQLVSWHGYWLLPELVIWEGGRKRKKEHPRWDIRSFYNLILGPLLLHISLVTLTNPGKMRERTIQGYEYQETESLVVILRLVTTVGLKIKIHVFCKNLCVYVT